MNLDSINLEGTESSTHTEQTESSVFASQEHSFTLRESVEIAMKNYFTQLDNEQPRDIYELVLAEVEAPLMEAVMSYTQGNQTKASQVLGLNRGTLRKKLKAHGLN
jgi:Fis family transcriptional regulator, factor for inversion stimulation protein